MIINSIDLFQGLSQSLQFKGSYLQSLLTGSSLGSSVTGSSQIRMDLNGNKILKIPYKNLDKALSFLRNQVFCRALTSSNYPTGQYFLLKLGTRFLLTIVYKRVCGIFLFCLDLELFAKTKKDLVSTHLYFTLLLITQDINKIKKSHTRFCGHYYVENLCKISAKKKKKSMVIGARQSFQFFIQKARFPGNNSIRFCIT